MYTLDFSFAQKAFQNLCIPQVTRLGWGEGVTLDEEAAEDDEEDYSMNMDLRVI